MKIQKIISILALLALSSTQCMKLSKQQTNPLSLQLHDHLIETLNKNIRKNTSNPALFYERSQRLRLLQNLLEKKINISFNNQDENIRYWAGKDNTIASKILYEKLLALLSYKTHMQHDVVIAHDPPAKETPLAVSLQINNSLLHFTATQPLGYDTNKMLKKFLYKYTQESTAQKISNPPIHTQQYTTYQNFALYPTNINATYECVELSENDYDLFMTLPYPIQEVLVAILLEK